MTTTQATPTTTAAPTCIATTEAGHVCGRPASVLDESRGGLVCGVHAPKFGRHYEVTRAVLAKVEDLLTQAAKHAHHETPKRQDESAVTVPILDLAVRTRRLRVVLSGAAVKLLLFLSLAGHAQSTYVNHRLDFAGNGSASTILTIGTNVLARMANLNASADITGTAAIRFPGSVGLQYDLFRSGGLINKPILGPATIQISAQGAGSEAVLYVLMQYETVNATLPAQTVVQPAGTALSISLQSSTDLVTWTPAAAGVYPASAGNRFFRMSLTR